MPKRVKKGQTIYYGELGERVDVPIRGPWKPVLDVISKEETAQERPDITFLVINKTYKCSGQVGFTSAKPPTVEQRALSDQKIKEVFDFYFK